MGIRMGALEAEAAAAGASEEVHHHFPGARRLHVDWSKDESGEWTYGSLDLDRWEVVCAECGDTDGPAAEQSAVVQQLRGPYSNERHAERAAEDHFERN